MSYVVAVMTDVTVVDVTNVTTVDLTDFTVADTTIASTQASEIICIATVSYISIVRSCTWLLSYNCKI